MGLLLAMALQIFIEGKARLVVQSAIEGATRKLSEPRCQAVFGDFADGTGRLLYENLRSHRVSGADFLSSLYYVEADPRRCRANETVVLFTAPDSRVIYVCTSRFADRFALNVRDGALLVIHELLHALGLGENPPSTGEITSAVRARCGA